MALRRRYEQLEREEKMLAEAMRIPRQYESDRAELSLLLQMLSAERQDKIMQRSSRRNSRTSSMSSSMSNIDDAATFVATEEKSLVEVEALLAERDRELDDENAKFEKELERIDAELQEETKILEHEMPNEEKLRKSLSTEEEDIKKQMESLRQIQKLIEGSSDEQKRERNRIAREFEKIVAIIGRDNLEGLITDKK